MGTLRLLCPASSAGISSAFSFPPWPMDGTRCWCLPWPWLCPAACARQRVLLYGTGLSDKEQGFSFMGQGTGLSDKEEATGPRAQIEGAAGRGTWWDSRGVPAGSCALAVAALAEAAGSVPRLFAVCSPILNGCRR